MQEPREPQRASLRLKGIASDGTSVHDELRGGKIVVKGTTGFTGHQAVEEEKPRAIPTGMAQQFHIWFCSCCSVHISILQLLVSRHHSVALATRPFNSV